ncbi:hypothetical protein Vi05172_g11824 [Venturia inaequalis]|nr:hypothetical protein Vi05172_g11824 [Venturia inaequalis]
MVSAMSETPSQSPVGDDQGTKKKATMTKGKGKTIEGKRARSLAVDDSIVLYSEPPVPVEESIEEENTIDKLPKRQTRRKVNKKETSHIEDTLNSSQISKPTRTRADRGKAKQRLTEDKLDLGQKRIEARRSKD